MKEYVEMLQEEMRLIEHEANELHEEAISLPYAERGSIARQWALKRGAVNGLEIALAYLQNYLDACVDLCYK
ncbi:MAG: hypothetical protein ABIH46_10785 [Chloroflexota bacterium]